MTATATLLAAITGIAALFVGQNGPPPPTTQSPGTSLLAAVRITYPPEGGVQNRCVAVGGTADLPQGQRLWVVVESEPDTARSDRTFYLQGERGINGGRQDFRGNWSLTVVYLGAEDRPDDDGARFKVHAVVTTGHASELFQDIIEAQVGRIGARLPQDARIIDTIEVIRKKPSLPNCPT
jgi:hypothetical protein